MNRGRAVVLAGICGAAMAATPSRAQSTGPDVIVGDISDVQYWGVTAGMAAYSVGTVACNIGTAPASWNGTTTQHPVIAQNVYSLKNGRFEQLGQSWAKHTYATVNDSFCGTCTGGTPSATGVGCSDPYNAAMNGGQARLGPRSEVNAATGAFAYPYGIGWQTTGDAIYKRCQVSLTGFPDAAALYFAEAQYVSPDDAMAGNGLNNVSYRRFTIGPPQYTSTVQDQTETMTPAIFAWRANGLGLGVVDPSVSLVAADYTEQGVTARFWVGARASDNGDGTWHYEYAVENLNSSRAAGGFSVPVPPGVAVSGAAWHGVPCHSGEVFDNSAWTISTAGGGVAFNSPQTYAANPEGNALRWGTLYNFRFDAAAPPITGAAVIGLFQPGAVGEPSSVSVQVPVPGVACYANCDGSTSPPVLNVADFTCYLQRFAAGDSYANCDASTAPPTLNVADFTCFLQKYAGGCP